jgi:hypothetical protein
MPAHARFDRRKFLAGAVAVPLIGPTAALAQQNIGEKKIEPLDLPLDKPGVWTLFFRYKPPRILTLDAIGKDGKPEKKVVWYMWYQVYNAPRDERAVEPVTFLPEFELVTKDIYTEPQLDEPQPHVVEQLRKIEDPTGVLNIQTTISISKRPIPPSKPDAIPRVVTGVAVWTDMAEKTPRTNRFSVYVTGLSNGLATEELRTGEKLIKRKTLQINFIRPTDDTRSRITDIRPDDANGPAEQWIYRTTSVAKTFGGAAPKLPPLPPK